MSNSLDDFADVPDEALLVLYANGDRRAARVLTGRFAPRVFGFAARILGDRAEAEDVAQEAMLRLWKVAPDWEQGKAKISTWLFRVTQNLCTDRLRKRRTVGIDEIAEPEDDGALSAEQVLMVDGRAEALKIALNALSDRQRTAIVLRHIEGLSNPEIAEILGISTEAVESLTARAKRALTTLLAGRRDELGFTDV